MKFFFVIVFLHTVLLSPSYSGIFDRLIENVTEDTKGEENDNPTIISGLKEALSIGTKKAVGSVSQVDGYFGNEAIKILMPDKMQKVANVLGKIGYQEEVDDFILSMNRAAEKAAPKATSFFIDSIKEMSISDAKMILNGGDTAATEYFKKKTFNKLYDSFKPIASESMNEVGVTRSYKNMMDKYTSLPFMKSELFDIDHYVTNKTLDGLFYMVAEEEKMIRTNPTARITDLLKKVFKN